jgi:hypothetical protein
MRRSGVRSPSAPPIITTTCIESWWLRRRPSYQVATILAELALQQRASNPSRGPLVVRSEACLDRRVGRGQPLSRRQDARISSIPNRRALRSFGGRSGAGRCRPHIGKDRSDNRRQQGDPSRSTIVLKTAEQDCRVTSSGRPSRRGGISRSSLLPGRPLLHRRSPL